MKGTVKTGKDKTSRGQQCPWANCIGHLALIVPDLEKAKWFFREVLQAPFYVFRETQLVVEIGDSLMVVKLRKDAVDPHVRTQGNTAQASGAVMDHYGFCANESTLVDQFYTRVQAAGLEIVKPPYDREDGRAFYFRDPFGNLVEYFFYSRVAL